MQQASKHYKNKKISLISIGVLFNTKKTDLQDNLPDKISKLNHDIFSHYLPQISTKVLKQPIFPGNLKFQMSPQFVRKKIVKKENCKGRILV